jgi:large subunit ribosomal protein L25
VGTQVFAKDLTLPKGTTLAGDPEALVLHVIEPRSQAQFDEEIGEGGEEIAAPSEVPPAPGTPVEAE